MMTEATLKLIIGGLNDAGVRYLVVGGLAVAAHGASRFTQDVDLIIELKETNIAAGLAVLKNLGYRPKVPVALEDFADPVKRESWIREKHMLAFGLRSDLHPETDVDIFTNDPLGFEEAYKRASHFELSPGFTLPVCSYEDLVKLKLLASRPKDLDDLRRLKTNRGE